MAQHPPGPNFDLIDSSIDEAATAAKTVSAEISKIRDIQGIQGSRDITKQLDDLKRELKAEAEKTRREITKLDEKFDKKFDKLRADLTKEANERIRVQNTQAYALNPLAILTPLRSIETGDPIPDCPTTLDKINHLPPNQVSRILEELGVVPPRQTETRVKVLKEQYLLQHL